MFSLLFTRTEKEVVQSNASLTQLEEAVPASQAFMIAGSPSDSEDWHAGHGASEK